MDDTALVPTEVDDFIHEELSPKEALFVHNFVVLRMTKTQAALAAGFKNRGSAAQLMQRPQVVDAITMLRDHIAERFAISRQDIIEGIKEGISYARILGEPGNMISGWREIAKITGQYEPENPDGKLSDKQKHILDVLEDMPEERLLELLEKDAAVLEGEFSRAEAPQAS